MAKYVLFKNGTFVNTINADADFDVIAAYGVGYTKEVFDANNPLHQKPVPTRVAPEFVSKDVFLFELLTPTEYQTLQFHIRQIDTQGEWGTPVPTTQTGLAYRGLDLAQRQLEMVSRVQLSSPRTSQFLDLCFALQFWGDPSDPAVQAAYATRKAAILNAERPDGSFVEA